MRAGIRLRGATAVLGVSAATAMAIGGIWVVRASAAPSQAAAADDNSIVEDYSYPGAAQVTIDDPRVVVVRGDGHIVVNKGCATPATGVGRIKVTPTAGSTSVCFDVLGATGWLQLKIDAVYEIDGRHATADDSHQATATIQAQGDDPTTVTLDKDFTTPVGTGADPNSKPTTLLELAVTAG